MSLLASKTSGTLKVSIVVQESGKQATYVEHEFSRTALMHPEIAERDFKKMLWALAQGQEVTTYADRMGDSAGR